MTITRWCPICSEDCTDHATICTVCGTPLQSSASVRAVPPQLERDLHNANQQLTSLLASLRTQVRDLREATEQTGDVLATLRDLSAAQAGGEWQEAPAEAMDPQQSASRSRPTAKATLESLPRITVGESTSFLFHQANLVVGNREFAAILGEFGPTHQVDGGKLVVVPDTRTGKGGLSAATHELIQANTSVVYMERGDGITFVKKALMAQNAGASAIVIGNNTATPWPYVMKDSKKEASSLTIPVVMVKQSDGNILVGMDGKECRLEFHENKKECVVCRDNFETSQTVIQLPACGHIFHEKCALTWLMHHNACPYCRRELPTDNAEYEQERRRTQRTHAGSTSSSSEWHDLYG